MRNAGNPPVHKKWEEEICVGKNNRGSIYHKYCMPAGAGIDACTGFYINKRGWMGYECADDILDAGFPGGCEPPYANIPYSILVIYGCQCGIFADAAYFFCGEKLYGGIVQHSDCPGCTVS